MGINKISNFIKLMQKYKHYSESDIFRYKKMLNFYLSEKSHLVEWKNIKSINESNKDFTLYNKLSDVSINETKNLLDKLVVVKLNGGLGTTMGCKGPKSIIPVKDNKSFLEIIIDQIKSYNLKHSVRIPLILFNSDFTEKETINAIGADIDKLVDITHIKQNLFPRICIKDNKDIDFLPENMGPNRYYPLGHGEIFAVLEESGTLKRLKELGKKIIFISNSDNLGALPDLKILKYLLDTKTQFLIEVAKRSVNDVKGGTPVLYNNKLTLLELVMVPDVNKHDFQDLNQFDTFHTNNDWVDIDALLSVSNTVPKFYPKDNEIFLNPKAINNYSTVQLEYAMGSFVSRFENSKAILVPRERFLPVKRTNELFILRSNLCEYKDGFMKLKSNSELPKIELDPIYYSKVHDFNDRVPYVPDISQLDQLKVTGNVYFEDNVSLQGNVEIIASSSQYVIQKGTVLKNQLLKA